METYSVSMIYSCLLTKGYKVSQVSEVKNNIYLVVMKNGNTTKSVLLTPKGQYEQPSVE